MILAFMPVNGTLAALKSPTLGPPFLSCIANATPGESWRFLPGVKTPGYPHVTATRSKNGLRLCCQNRARPLRGRKIGLVRAVGNRPRPRSGRMMVAGGFNPRKSRATHCVRREATHEPAVTRRHRTQRFALRLID